MATKWHYRRRRRRRRSSFYMYSMCPLLLQSWWMLVEQTIPNACQLLTYMYWDVQTQSTVVMHSFVS